MAIISYKENSRLDWGNDDESLLKSGDKIQLGAILRIADAVEILTKDWSKMKQDLEWYKTAYRSKKEDLEAEVRRKNTYKGHLTRAKNRIKELEAQLAEKGKPTGQLIQCPQCRFDWSAQEIEVQSCFTCGYKQ